MTGNYQLVYYDAQNVGIIGILAYPINVIHCKGSLHYNVCKLLVYYKINKDDYLVNNNFSLRKCTLLFLENKFDFINFLLLIKKFYY